jgi:hypothetical protein
MESRFASVNVPVNMIESVSFTDSRIPATMTNPRMHSMTLGHLRMIHSFLESDAEYGVFCEDDIFVRKSFSKDIHVAIDAYKRLNLSVLLLGYLTNYRASSTQIHSRHTALETPFTFLSVNSDTWGSQMYMLDKKWAAECVKRFDDYTQVTAPFSPDWTITKMPGGACMYPMLAVESGTVNTDHWGQVQFHRTCFETNYTNEYV